MNNLARFVRDEALIEAHKAYWTSPVGIAVRGILLERALDMRAPDPVPPVQGLRTEVHAFTNAVREGSINTVKFLDLLTNPTVKEKVDEPQPWDHLKKQETTNG